MNEVEYRPIVGHESYHIGSDGSLLSTHSGKRKQIAAQPDKDGYMQVDLYKHGKRCARKIHRLVLEAFVGPCPDGMEAAHDDGNPANNAIGNLRWATPLENHSDKRKHGTNRYGDSHPRARYTSETLDTVRKLRNNGASFSEIARLTGVSGSSVRRIVSGKQRVSA